MEERIVNVHWYGPFPIEESEIGGSFERDESFVLYLICGTHGLYGRNIPLYIGKTERDLSKRVKEHFNSWLKYEPDAVFIFTACFHQFDKGGKWDDLPDDYSYPDDVNLITDVENLLIFGHNPVYNRRQVMTLPKISHDLRIFNTGKRSILYPELSGFFYGE